MSSTLDADREHAIVLTLNIRNRVTGFKVCHPGSGDRSVMAPEVIFRDALALGAARIIFAHNHPSGDPSPRAEDIESTKRLKRAGEIVGIPFLDGLVIGHESAVSMQERGLLQRRRARSLRSGVGEHRRRAQRECRRAPMGFYGSGGGGEAMGLVSRRVARKRHGSGALR